MADIRSMELEQIKGLMAGLSEKEFRARQLYAWMHKRLVNSYEQMTDLPQSL